MNERRDLRHLKKIIEDGREQRRRAEDFQKWITARFKEVRAAPMHAKTSFYCDECDADFDAIGIKQVRKPEGAVWHAYYLAYCPKRHPSVRYITDRMADPYFYKSFVVKREQARHADDFLTPAHPRFKIVYPKAYADLIARGDIKL